MHPYRKDTLMRVEGCEIAKLFAPAGALLGHNGSDVVGIEELLPVTRVSLHGSRLSSSFPWWLFLEGAIRGGRPVGVAGVLIEACFKLFSLLSELHKLCVQALDAALKGFFLRGKVEDKPHCPLPQAVLAQFREGFLCAEKPGPFHGEASHTRTDTAPIRKIGKTEGKLSCTAQVVQNSEEKDAW